MPVRPVVRPRLPFLVLLVSVSDVPQFDDHLQSLLPDHNTPLNILDASIVLSIQYILSLLLSGSFRHL